jgi:hypothetical protein
MVRAAAMASTGDVSAGRLSSVRRNLAADAHCFSPRRRTQISLASDGRNVLPDVRG